MFGVQADGARSPRWKAWPTATNCPTCSRSFSDRHGLQCGFCTPGFLMLAEGYLAKTAGAEPTEAEIRELVAANLCRCTGYQGIVEAVLATARAPPAPGPPVNAIGVRAPRKEDPRLLRGLGRFGSDFSARGQLWARVVRSPVAHGRLRAVDVSQARQAAGVAAAVTAADLPGRPQIPVRLAMQDIDLSRYLQPVLADNVVRYVGEPLAVLVAEDPYLAEDAAELVDIDIEPGPAVLDAHAAAGPDSPQLHPGGNVAAEFSLGFGDVAAAFATAARVVQVEVAIGRHAAVPLEPRTLLADVNRVTGALDIFGMTKVPVFNRDLLAALLGMDETLIHVHAVDAGGGFGARGEFYPEDFLVPWLARTLRRPVKWVEDRAEHLVAVNHSRQQAHRLAAAFDAGGRITGLRADVVHDPRTDHYRRAWRQRATAAT